jgi:hypothetical protein
VQLAPGSLQRDSRSDAPIEVGNRHHFGLVQICVVSIKRMSTSISIETLPSHRKPIAFGGTGRDPIWQIDSSYITGDLEAVRDSLTHVSIMPRATMLLAQYELALANTQKYWQRVENFI